MPDRDPPTLAALTQQFQSPHQGDRLQALISLRNIPAQEALPLIRQALEDDSVQVRNMAIFALGAKPTAASLDLLVTLLQTDPDYGIRASAAGALGYLDDNRAFEPLLHSFYEDTDWLVRFSTAVSLGNLRDDRARSALLDALHSDDPLLHQAAIAALGEIGAMDTIDQLLDFASSEDWLIRQRLAEALGNLPCAQSRSALRYLAKDSHPQVAAAAEYAIQRLDSPPL